MRAVKSETKERKLGKAMKKTRQERYILSLYVTGITSRSTTAIDNVKKICEEYLKGRYELRIIDIYQQPELAQDEQIVAAPTLIKRLPPPLRRLIGDMSDKNKFLAGFDLKQRKI